MNTHTHHTMCDIRSNRPHLWTEGRKSSLAYRLVLPPGELHCTCATTECYRRRQTTDASKQNNTAPTLCVGGPVITAESVSQADACWYRVSSYSFNNFFQHTLNKWRLKTNSYDYHTQSIHSEPISSCTQ